jgi:hypothetical protein
MSKIKHLILLVVMTFMFKLTSAQAPLGDWRAFCPFEATDNSGTTVCKICPLINRGGDGFTIQGLEMKIEKEQIKFTFNADKQETVNYKWDESSKTMTFTFNKVDYKFKLFYAKNMYILKNSDGQMLLLADKSIH